jgi:hypothetical protein
MTNVQKNQIVDAIQREIGALGSGNKVSVKCEVSNATISNMINGKWELIKTEMWMQVASKLNVHFSGWQIAETTNFKMMWGVLNDAKEHSLFIPVAFIAGSGKTTGVDEFAKAHSESVYVLKADEWAKREFLTALALTLGIEPPKGGLSVSQIGVRISNFFNERAFTKPLLVIDEFKKLKAPAKRWIISFFNRIEDKAGLVVVGTEDLEEEIKRGVRLKMEGYDELESRLGRNYVKLFGATLNDVELICKANGINEREKAAEIFTECKPVAVVYEDKKTKSKQTLKVVQDMRRVKRVIKRELLTQTV